MTVLSDAELIATAGSASEALGPLFERHFDAVYRYLYRRVGPDLAKDLASETFVQALSHLDAYRTDRPDARPWLLGIATNLLHHHARAEARRLKAYARSASLQAAEPDVSEGADAKALALALAPELVEALAGMDRDQRDVLVLHTWADLTYEQMAEALDVPVGTVRSRLSRGRARIRELLEAEGAITTREQPKEEQDGR